MVAAGRLTAYKGREPMSPATSEPTGPLPNAASSPTPGGGSSVPTQVPDPGAPGDATPVASAKTPAPTAAAKPPKGRSKKARRRHARVVIRKIGPWSVFKLSLIFYLCLMLVILGAGVILYGMLGAIGALDSVTRLIRDLFAEETFVVNGGWLFTRGLGIGLVMVVVWSLINVFVVFLYNLISDLVGGVEITLAERR
jgi:hypothetical protein